MRILLSNPMRAARTALMICLLAIMPATLFALQTSTTPAPAPLTLAAKVLGLATGVFTLLQAMKRYLFPSLSGNAAVALNLVLSVLAAVTTMPADQLFSGTTLLAILSVVASSSGLHGIWQTVFGSGSTTQAQ